MLTPAVVRLIDLALEEDLGRGDVTSEALLPPEALARGAIVAKQALVLCGLEVAAAVLARVDPRVRFEPLVGEGVEVAPRTEVARVDGAARGLLAAERTALNFLQRMSGVATQARRYAAAVGGTSAKVVDTRKTLPGWRWLDKHAVAVGGAGNHRADLSSGLLIKDNHVAACGGVGEAVARARAHAPHPLRIEVEVTDLAQLDEALAGGAEIVLLDNMDDELVAEAVRRARGRALVEVSGGIELVRVGRLARLGVDLISVGRLTHSAPAVDLSLELEPAR